MNPRQLLAKAARAAESASVLLEARDPDGACNRAYYAMHDAAMAALLASRSISAAQLPRTHSGLVNAFGQHLVRGNVLPADLGRQLNRVKELRLIADYQAGGITKDNATWAVHSATQFVEVVGGTLLPPGSPDA